MEQVLAPNWKFKTKVSDDDKAKPGEIKIRGLKEPSSQRVKEIIDDDLPDLKAAIFQDTTMLKAMPDPAVVFVGLCEIEFTRMPRFPSRYP